MSRASEVAPEKFAPPGKPGISTGRASDPAGTISASRSSGGQLTYDSSEIALPKSLRESRVHIFLILIFADPGIEKVSLRRFGLSPYPIDDPVAAQREPPIGEEWPNELLSGLLDIRHSVPDLILRLLLDAEFPDLLQKQRRKD